MADVPVTSEAICGGDSGSGNGGGGGSGCQDPAATSAVTAAEVRQSPPILSQDLAKQSSPVPPVRLIVLAPPPQQPSTALLSASSTSSPSISVSDDRLRTSTSEKRVRFPPDQKLEDIRLISPRAVGVKWRVIADSGEPPFQRCWHAAWGTDRGMYVFGGVFFNANKELFALSDLHCFDWESAKWRTVEPKGLEQPRGGWAMSCAFSKKRGAYMLGGRDHEFNISQVLWHFEADTETWTRVFEHSPPVCAGGMVVMGSQLVIFGGITRFADKKACGAVYTNRVSSFDIESGKWTEQPTRGTLPTPRAWHSMCSLDSSRLIIYGGTDTSSVLNELFMLDIRTWTWTKLDAVGDIPPHLHSAVLTRRGKAEKGIALLHGGGVPYVSGTADCIRSVVIDTDGQKTIAKWAIFRGNLGLAPVLFGHTAVRSGSSVFFFGGQDSLSRYHKELFTIESLFGDFPSTPSQQQQHVDPKTVVKVTGIAASSSPTSRHRPTSKQKTLAVPSPQLQRISPRPATVIGTIHDSEAVGSWKKAYEVVKKLGRGGFSSIFLVKELSTGNQYAAKRANLAAASSETRLRSLREVRVHGGLPPHPYIVRFHEAFLAKGSMESVLVMEYCPRGDLYNFIRDCGARRSTIPLSQAIEWFTSIVLAVSHLHRVGLVHADLKSANVLFAEDGSIRLADLGMTDKPAAPHRRQAIFRLHELTGTPDYMAPEMLPPTFSPPSFSTDVWALGVLLYELLTLRLPFGGDGGTCANFDVLAEKIVKQTYDPIQAGCCTPAEEALVASLLSKKAASRPSAWQILTMPICSRVIQSLQNSPACAHFTLMT